MIMNINKLQEQHSPIAHLHFFLVWTTETKTESYSEEGQAYLSCWPLRRFTGDRAGVPLFSGSPTMEMRLDEKKRIAVFF
jgi:hypothetical protein